MVTAGAVARMRALSLLLLTAAAGAVSLSAHPIHTTLTQVTHDAGARRVTLSIRVFADDFQAALGAAGRGSGFGAAAHAYVRRTVVVRSPRGKALPLEWCGERREGEVIWLCVRTPAGVSGLEGLRLHNRMFFERFPDQLNLVQAVVGGRRRTLVFTRGDGVKPLR